MHSRANFQPFLNFEKVFFWEKKNSVLIEEAFWEISSFYPHSVANFLKIEKFSNLKSCRAVIVQLVGNSTKPKLAGVSKSGSIKALTFSAWRINEG